jgi:hypothetical protein
MNFVEQLFFTDQIHLVDLILNTRPFRAVARIVGAGLWVVGSILTALPNLKKQETFSPLNHQFEPQSAIDPLIALTSPSTASLRDYGTTSTAQLKL